MRLDLLPQLAHEDAEVMRVVDVDRAPDFFQQVLVRDHVAGVLRQHLEQPVFLRRQRQALVVEQHRARGEIDDQRADFDNRLAACRTHLAA